MKIKYIIISILIGILSTLLIINNKEYKIKEEYLVYGLQVGEYQKLNSISINKDIPSIIIYNNDSYKVYVGIYKNIDILNKMLVYFENNTLKVYINNIKVNKEFYNNIDTYEKLLRNTSEDKIYKSINKSILELYRKENNEKIIIK